MIYDPLYVGIYLGCLQTCGSHQISKVKQRSLHPPQLDATELCLTRLRFKDMSVGSKDELDLEFSGGERRRAQSCSFARFKFHH